MLARTKLSAKNNQTNDLLVFVRSPFYIDGAITRHVGDYTVCSSEEDAPREELLRIPRYQGIGGGVSQLRRYFISLAPPVD